MHVALYVISTGDKTGQPLAKLFHAERAGEGWVGGVRYLAVLGVGQPAAQPPKMVNLILARAFQNLKIHR